MATVVSPETAALTLTITTSYTCTMPVDDHLFHTYAKERLVGELHELILKLRAEALAQALTALPTAPEVN